MDDLKYTALYAAIFGINILNKRVYLDTDEIVDIFLGDDIDATIQTSRDSKSC